MRLSIYSVLVYCAVGLNATPVNLFKKKPLVHSLTEQECYLTEPEAKKLVEKGLGPEIIAQAGQVKRALNAKRKEKPKKSNTVINDDFTDASREMLRILGFDTKETSLALSEPALYQCPPDTKHVASKMIHELDKKKASTPPVTPEVDGTDMALLRTHTFRILKTLKRQNAVKHKSPTDDTAPTLPVPLPTSGQATALPVPFPRPANDPLPIRTTSSPSGTSPPDGPVHLPRRNAVRRPPKASSQPSSPAPTSKPLTDSDSDEESLPRHEDIAPLPQANSDKTEFVALPRRNAVRRPPKAVSDQPPPLPPRKYKAVSDQPPPLPPRQPKAVHQPPPLPPRQPKALSAI